MRLLAAVGLIGFLIGLCVWWTGLIVDGRIGHMGLVQHAEAHDGRHVVLSLVTVVDIRPPDRFRVAEGMLEFDVVGPTEGRRTGEELYVVGRFDAETRSVVAERIAPAPGRSGKKALGLLGLVALATLLPVWFVPEREGLAVRG